MLKLIHGIMYMTGTSEGSLYPVVLTHPNGLHLGLRLNIGKTDKPGLWAVGLYARIEKIIEDEPVPATTAELFEALPNMVARFASPTHVSGPFGNGVFDSAKVVKPPQTTKAMALAFGDLFVDVVSKIALMSKGTMQPLSEANLRTIGAERYMSQVGGEVEETQLEQQLNKAAPFDFISLLSKPGHSDPK